MADNDSLRLTQANEWFKVNVDGKRATWTGLKATTLKFESEGGNKYTASVIGGGDETNSKIDLYGRTWSFYIGGGIFSHNFKILGLSKDAAERLREMPDDKMPEFTFKVTSAYFVGQEVTGGRAALFVRVTDVGVKGFGP